MTRRMLVRCFWCGEYVAEEGAKIHKECLPDAIAAIRRKARDRMTERRQRGE